MASRRISKDVEYSILGGGGGGSGGGGGGDSKVVYSTVRVGVAVADIKKAEPCKHVGSMILTELECMLSLYTKWLAVGDNMQNLIINKTLIIST